MTQTTQEIILAARALVAGAGTYNSKHYFSDAQGRPTEDQSGAASYSIGGAVFQAAGAHGPNPACRGYQRGVEVLDFLAIGLPVTAATLRAAQLAIRGATNLDGSKIDGDAAIVQWEFHDKPSHGDILDFFDRAIASRAETCHDYFLWEVTRHHDAA